MVILSSLIQLIQNEIKTLQQTHATTLVTLEQHKRRHLDLSHRLLSVIVRQEVMRKKGFTMSESEEGLRNKLDSIQQELNAPTQFKVRHKKIEKTSCNYPTHKKYSSALTFAIFAS